MRAEVDMINAPKPENARSQKGSVVVEFALILPLFLALLFGVITVSVALYDKTVLTMATRQGAREGAKFVAGDDDDDIRARARAATIAACQNIISFTPGGAAADVPVPTINAADDTITVTASVDYTGIFVVSDLLDITAETTMRLER